MDLIHMKRKVNKLGTTLLLALFSFFTFQSNAQYCAATNTDCGFEFITNVSVGTINNNSACDAPYDDFTAQVTSMQQGVPYAATVTKSGTVATYVSSIYVDWNQNQVFDLPGEEIQGQANATTTGFTYTITPPAGATLGQTRMRVRMVQLSNTPNPCGANTRGDLEDYTINVVPPAPPANNTCANAQPITPGASCTPTNGTTINATQQDAPSNCSGNTAGNANDVWYSFVANGTSSYEINVTGTGNFDPVLQLYSACGSTNQISCVDATLLNGTETISAGVLAAGTYYYRVYGNGGDGNFTTCVVEISGSGPTYCAAANTDCNFEYITFVGLTTIGNTTDCGQPYDDYTNQIAYLQVGGNYTGWIKKSDILNNYLAHVFIDWNQDGTFGPTEEIVANAQGTSDFSFTVIPPPGALTGNTRMRVRMTQNAAPPACGNAGRGDIEDYTINLSSNPAPTPVNDDCSNAYNVTPTLTCGSIPYNSTLTATQSYAPGSCANTTTANDVWFSFSANGSSAYEIYIQGTDGFDPVIELYDACAAANMIQCQNIESGPSSFESLNTGVLPAGNYFYRVYGDNQNGRFYHCIKELLPADEYDCETARLLCDKSTVFETNVTGYGLNGNEAVGSCLAGGVDVDGTTEQNSKWYRWTAANNGDLIFDIIPVEIGTTDSLDIDFVVFELDPNLGCEGKVQLRCMGASCKGPTGLDMTSVDLNEPPDCLPPNDSYLRFLTQTQGTEYALLVNNFDAPGRDYSIQFGGTAEFLGGVADFTAAETPSCTTPKTVTYTDASLGADTYAWDFGADANPPTATTAGPHNVTYSTAGPKTVSLTVVATNGCDSTLTMIVDVTDTMDITATIVDATCEQPNGEITVNVTGGYGTAADKMYSLDGGTAQASNQFTGVAPGPHTITVTDLNGCSQSVTVTVNTTLNPDIDDLPDPSACDNYSLPAISGTNLTNNASYYTGPGGTGTALAPGTIITANQTLYIYDFTNSVPQCTDEESFTVTINEAPVVANMTRTCDGTGTTYTVSFDVSGGNGGPYTVTEIAPGGIGGSFTGNTWTSNAIPSGTAFQFDVDDANGCGPVSVTGVRDCNCATQVGSMSSTAIEVCGSGSATATYNAANENSDGNDVIEYILHDASGATIGNELQSNNAPTFSFQAPMVYGTTYYISAIYGNPDGTGGVDQTDPCLDVAAGTPVTWYETPTADFSGATDICNGGSATLTFTFTGQGPFAVTINNGTSNQTFTNMTNGSTATVSPTATRTYSLVSVTSSSTACSGTVAATTVTVTVNDPPNVSTPTYTCNATNTGYFASFDVTGGTGGPYTVTEIQPGGIGGSFTGNTYTTNEIPNGVIFEFDVDDANGCGPTNVSGVHNCTCASDAGDMGTQPINICGNGPANATHNQANMVLDGNDALSYVIHTNSSNILGTVIDSSLTSTFSFGPGMTYGTTYYISAIVGNDQGNGYADRTDPCLNVAVGTPVTWNETPTTTAGANNTDVCEGDNIELTATFANGADYSWSGPGSYVAFEQNPVRQNATTGMSGQYTVTVSNNGCSSTSQVNVNVNPLNNASISANPNDPFCQDDPAVQLSAATAGGTWSGNGVNGSGMFDPAAAGPGTHTITYSFGGQCPSSDTRDIVVTATPNININAVPQSGCDPLNVRFYNNTQNTTSISWEFGDSEFATNPDSVDHVYSPGTYDVVVSLISNGCPATQTFNGYITVNQSPTASFVPVAGSGGEFSFVNESQGAAGYIWRFGDGTESNEENPIHDYGDNGGKYSATLIAISPTGCTDSTTVTVSIEEDVIFYVPNAFTPNADAVNQDFMPRLTSGIDLTSYRLQIFNRWGELIFESRDVDAGWNGAHKNAKSPAGIYSWKLEFTAKNNDRKYEIDGIVTLMR